jgi:serine phosphatase RsbU (regulator of sigma subunit)
MTASIEDLLRQKAIKERLEQELRIAREIQMSLLPQRGLHLPGLSLSGHCEPAREVGGDYYDFFPLEDGRVGVLIADVAGKGTSAALYMAELKGLMLSLSQSGGSPRQILLDVNRIITNHLDDRSFITATYAVIDPVALTLTYARAGHCPLIFRPGLSPGDRRARLMAPEGLVLGLKIDNGAMFERLLEEATVPLGPGDLFLLFTDGVTEAMNAEGDCFGEARLAAIVEEHGDSSADVLRERILGEVRAFAGAAGAHDDVTMVVVNISSPAAASV